MQYDTDKQQIDEVMLPQRVMLQVDLTVPFSVHNQKNIKLNWPADTTSVHVPSRVVISKKRSTTSTSLVRCIIKVIVLNMRNLLFLAIRTCPGAASSPHGSSTAVLVNYNDKLQFDGVLIPNRCCTYYNTAHTVTRARLSCGENWTRTRDKRRMRDSFPLFLAKHMHNMEKIMPILFRVVVLQVNMCEKVFRSSFVSWIQNISCMFHSLRFNVSRFVVWAAI